MDFVGLKNILRKNVVSASGIDPEKDLQIAGMVFDSTNKEFWVEEFVIGGEYRVLSNKRIQSNAYLVQYDFNTHSGSSTDTIEQMASAVIEKIPPGAALHIFDADCIIKETKINRVYGKNINTVSVLFTISFNFSLTK